LASYEWHPIKTFLHGNFHQYPGFTVSGIKNHCSVFYSCGTTELILCQPRPSIDISEQNEQIPLQNVCIIWKQVRYIKLLDEIDLLSFGQSGAIGEWFSEFRESRHDAE
jgi:hypothetical protein